MTLMPNFSARSTLPELMDEPDIPVADIRSALGEIEMINRLLGGYGIVINALRDLNIIEKARILDVGCGSGDMLRKISGWAIAQGKQVELIGIDLNPDTVAFAQERSAGCDIEYRMQDIYDEELLKERFDIVTCSLFCHHFRFEELVQVLRRMKQMASKAIIINDLHRHWFAYYSIGFLTKIFAKSRLVRYDAKLSVARAFTRSDWERTLAAAGIESYTLKWRWAWRWQLVIRLD